MLLFSTTNLATEMFQKSDKFSASSRAFYLQQEQNILHWICRYAAVSLPNPIPWSDWESITPTKLNLPCRDYWLTKLVICSEPFKRCRHMENVRPYKDLYRWPTMAFVNTKSLRQGALNVRRDMICGLNAWPRRIDALKMAGITKGPCESDSFIYYGTEIILDSERPIEFAPLENFCWKQIIYSSGLKKCCF